MISVSRQVVLAGLKFLNGVAKCGPHAKKEATQSQSDEKDIGGRHARRDAPWSGRRGMSTRKRVEAQRRAFQSPLALNAARTYRSG